MEKHASLQNMKHDGARLWNFLRKLRVTIAAFLHQSYRYYCIVASSHTLGSHFFDIHVLLLSILPILLGGFRTTAEEKVL
jgi:hypothetical protein